jgi:hypothetical protein
MSVKEWMKDRQGPQQPGALKWEQPDNEEKRAVLEPDVRAPFDRRTEVSADAKYIVRKLVLWLLVLPTVLGLIVWAISR